MRGKTISVTNGEWREIGKKWRLEQGAGESQKEPRHLQGRIGQFIYLVIYIYKYHLSIYHLSLIHPSGRPSISTTQVGKIRRSASTCLLVLQGTLFNESIHV